jgi:acyl carrier protein
MDENEVFDVVREALIWVKSDVVTLAPSQVDMGSVLAEPPIYLDSIEFVAMVARMEEALGLVAEDEHFFPRRLRTVRDVVGAVQRWIAGDQTRLL